MALCSQTTFRSTGWELFTLRIYVELAALGPGIEQMDSFTRNTDMFDMMVSLAGVASYAQD
ncbi:MAG: hypothetical protein U5K69_27445 [Balneolaceae bacterium]|nr:hypothetical protein [Balneolaceae bacterium]